MQSAGLIYDDSRHYIDHLGPFCALHKWPLIVCEPIVEDLVKYYYPDLQVIRVNSWDLVFPSTLVTCDTKSLIESSLGVKIDSQVLWLPHGHSDKGWKESFFKALRGEKTALVYGQKMIDLIMEENISIPMIQVGNFRWKYWMKHQSFYQKIIQKIVHPKNKTYLYAPTWDDAENNSSFWQVFPSLAKEVPSNCHLIVKIHPNTYLQHFVEIEKIIGKFQRENICFLTDFPPIYPLLSICDAYIGDMSSIGYDFLKFNRPMFFLSTHNKNFPLYSCGTIIHPEQISSLFHPQKDSFKKIRKQIYDYTFT
jgi:hypothetical protein